MNKAVWQDILRNIRSIDDCRDNLDRETVCRLVLHGEVEGFDIGAVDIASWSSQ